jgi:putative SOS response-associated peptidase YedK
MCGRFAQFSDLRTLATRFGVAEAAVRAVEWPPRYNIAPSTPILAVRLDGEGQRELVRLKWGLLPHWSVEPKTGYSTSNARAETVDTKPTFRAAFKRRRCLIPADGWFEWQLIPDQKYKQPWYYRSQDGEPLGLAGLWEHWQQADTVIESCTIIVCTANAVARAVHDRMPVILGYDGWSDWLDPETPAEAARTMLQPCPEGWIRTHPVNRTVSMVKNEGPGLIEPLAADLSRPR